MTRPTSYIGLGSNLDDPRAQIERAFEQLTELPGTRLTGQSRLYRSTPVGPQNQPDFINAVAALETELAPEALLDELQAIEQRHHRQRLQHWGPRTLDLDILLYADQRINTARLTVPHPYMGERSFVLEPLAELAPNLTLPDRRGLDELRRACGRDGLAVLQ